MRASTNKWSIGIDIETTSDRANGSLNASQSSVFDTVVNYATNHSSRSPSDPFFPHHLRNNTEPRTIASTHAQRFYSARLCTLPRLGVADDGSSLCETERHHHTRTRTHERRRCRCIWCFACVHAHTSSTFIVTSPSRCTPHEPSVRCVRCVVVVAPVQRAETRCFFSYDDVWRQYLVAVASTPPFVCQRVRDTQRSHISRVDSDPFDAAPLHRAQLDASPAHSVVSPSVNDLCRCVSKPIKCTSGQYGGET